jgi:hypothetical protein
MQLPATLTGAILLQLNAGACEQLLMLRRAIRNPLSPRVCPHNFPSGRQHNASPTYVVGSLKVFEHPKRRITHRHNQHTVCRPAAVYCQLDKFTSVSIPPNTSMQMVC